MQPRSFIAPFPIGGVVRRFPYHGQRPNTTPSALNVWPTDWETGRERGGSRPGLTSHSTVAPSPYNWCEVSYVDSNDVSQNGVCVVCANGAYVAKFSETGAYTDWLKVIGASVDFPPSTSVAMHLQRLIVASQGISSPQTIYLPGGTTSPNGDPAVGSLAQIISARNSANQPSDLDLPPAPEYCGICVTHGNRLVLAGDKKNPHNAYFSRIGDYADFDYSSVDAKGAYATAGSSGGVIGEAITSLIPHSNDCLLIGCTNSMYVLRGDPRRGGTTQIISRTNAPVMQSAWCKTGNDWTFMVTREGLMSMPPGCGVAPTPVSEDVLPKEMIGINPKVGDKVSIEYDALWKGIHIYINYNSGINSYFFYDMKKGGFWPMEFVGEMRLAVRFNDLISKTKSSLLAIADNGAASQFDINSTESYESYVYYGPIELSSIPNMEGQVAKIGCVLGENSDAVSIEVFVGDSAQQAFNSPSNVFQTNAFAIKGLNFWVDVRRRGRSAYIKASTKKLARMQIEELFGEVVDESMARKN